MFIVYNNSKKINKHLDELVKLVKGDPRRMPYYLGQTTQDQGTEEEEDYGLFDFEKPNKKE
jgi:hypothetical protein